MSSPLSAFQWQHKHTRSAIREQKVENSTSHSKTGEKMEEGDLGKELCLWEEEAFEWHETDLLLPSPEHFNSLSCKVDTQHVSVLERTWSQSPDFK
jgi:hypothetical protein